MKSRSKVLALALATTVTFIGASPSDAFDLRSVPSSFLKLAKSKPLARAGIVVIDPTTDEVIFEDAPDVTRAPASVLKILSMATTLKALPADKIFTTTISRSLDTSTTNTYVMTGDGDPWVTTVAKDAKRLHRSYSPTLINAILKEDPSLKQINIQFNGVYQKDLDALAKMYAKKIKFTFTSISSQESITAIKGAELAHIASPPLSEIINYTLLWSDNVLADRLARTSAKALGFPTSNEGIQFAFQKVLADLGVDFTGLTVFDGNGLSHEDRISARTLAELLVRVHTLPELAPIYEGLPVAGKTGTLRRRYKQTAPKAVGLVVAKTGWINQTVSLAGFVNSGEKQYAFAVIADGLKPTEKNRQATRVAIDKMLATIAKPKPAL